MSVVRPKYYQSVSEVGKPFLIAAYSPIDTPLVGPTLAIVKKLHKQFSGDFPESDNPTLLDCECRIVQKFLEAGAGWKHAELTAIKYLWRAGDKGSVLEDLKKARFYFLDSWNPESFKPVIAMLGEECLKLEMYDYESQVIEADELRRSHP